MNNYKRIMEEMSPEKLANLNVKLVTVNNESLFYLTSTGQLFPMQNKRDALVYEYNWLMSDVAQEETLDDSSENDTKL